MNERWYFCTCDGWKDYAGGCERCRQQMTQWVPVEDAAWLAEVVYEFLLVGPRQRTMLNEREMDRFLKLRRVFGAENVVPDRSRRFRERVSDIASGALARRRES